jgi:hypothetical protein
MCIFFILFGINMLCFTFYITKIDCDIYNIEQEPTQPNERTQANNPRQ